MVQPTSRSPKKKLEQWRKIWGKLGLWQSGKNRRNCCRKSLCRGCTLWKRSLWEVMDCYFIATEKEEIWSLASEKILNWISLPVIGTYLEEWDQEGTISSIICIGLYRKNRVLASEASTLKKQSNTVITKQQFKAQESYLFYIICLFYGEFFRNTCSVSS